MSNPILRCDFVAYFYDEVYPHREPDHLWVDSIHILIQTRITPVLWYWAMTGKSDRWRSRRALELLGLYYAASYQSFGKGLNSIRPILYSDVDGASMQTKGGNWRARVEIAKRAISMLSILGWAYEEGLYPLALTQKKNRHSPLQQRQHWHAVVEMYDDWVKKNGGLPDPDNYKRAWDFDGCVESQLKAKYIVER